ncbi:MAG: transposase [Actinomycetota bacterium]|nr:transposase [Actinomycetota bacterium]
MNLDSSEVAQEKLLSVFSGKRALESPAKAFRHPAGRPVTRISSCSATTVTSSFARTALINRAHKDLVVSHPGYETRIPKLTSKRNLKSAMTLLRGDDSMRAELLRDRIAEIRRLEDKVGAIEKQIAVKVSETGTTLTQVRGIGFIVAAKILGEIGDLARLRSKGSFIMLTGTAPIEASSGKTQRHRLNRGGNRQLNYALYMMAVARCRGDADTQVYMARLRIEGKTNKEAMRCLKRHLSNVVFKRLLADLKTLGVAA